MESPLKEIKQRIFRPPSVSEALWGRVPAEIKGDALLYLATHLRAGVHPEIALKKFLRDSGVFVEPPVVAIKPPTLKPVGLSRPKATPTRPTATGVSSASGGGGFRLKARSTLADIDTVPSFEFDDEMKKVDYPVFSEPLPEIRKTPIYPFGLKKQMDVADVPIGHIGHALHRLLGFSGDPDNRAAKLEASILRGISLDPEYVLAEPEGLGNLGCEVPISIISSIRDLIIDEAKLVISDILMRKENDDPTVSDWHDADDWLDN